MPARQASRACRLGKISALRVTVLLFLRQTGNHRKRSVPRQVVHERSTMPTRTCAPTVSRKARMTKIASNLQIDSARLWDTIHETAKFGATPKGGVRRLTLGPEDKQVRDWFRTACEAAGLEVHVDALGSMFGLRKGRDMSKPPVGLGSHLDTQPTGGKFDGVLGTLAALEVVRTLNDAGIETEIADLHRQLDQRGRLALRAGDDGLGRLCRRFHHRRYSVAQGCRRRQRGRSARRHRLSRREAGRHAEIQQLRRTAYRARPDARSRGQDHRRGRFRPGRVVV